MSVQDALIVAVVVLYLALLYVWAQHRRLDDERDKDSVRLAVLEGRADLLTRAARELRDRDLDRTQKMSAQELARVRRATPSDPGSGSAPPAP